MPGWQESSGRGSSQPLPQALKPRPPPRFCPIIGWEDEGLGEFGQYEERPRRGGAWGRDLGRAGRGTNRLGRQVALLELRLPEVTPLALVAEQKSLLCFRRSRAFQPASRLGSATVYRQYRKITFGFQALQITAEKKMNSLPREAYLQS